MRNPRARLEIFLIAPIVVANRMIERAGKYFPETYTPIETVSLQQRTESGWAGRLRNATLLLGRKQSQEIN